MQDFLFLILLTVVGIIAGFLNVMAGGGSAISLPLLIFLGLDSPLANGTNRLAIFIQTIASIISFKQEKFFEFKTSLKLAAFALPGAVAGAILAVKIDSVLFQRVLAIFILGILLTVIIPGSKRNKNVQAGKPAREWLIYPIMLVIGFVGGFHQVGIGFLMIGALSHVMKMDLVRINMHKASVFFIYTIPALAVFAWTSNINLKYGLALAVGNAVGGWWSAKIAVRKGERAIRIVLAVAMLIMAVKLLNSF
ncbi:MAG: sulfite exporter TauE/SafE family protein [Thermodesulfobacteriota bacterium]